MKNETTAQDKTPVKKTFKISGTLYGKFAVIRVEPEAVEVRSLSTALIIVALWMTAFILFILATVLLGNLFWGGLIALIGGIASIFPMMKFYKGKLDRRMEYKQIVSFVQGDGEYYINLADGYLYSIRISARKQTYLNDAIMEMLLDQPEIKTVHMGNYLKLYPVKKADNPSSQS